MLVVLKVYNFIKQKHLFLQNTSLGCFSLSKLNLNAIQCYNITVPEKVEKWKYGLKMRIRLKQAIRTGVR